MADNTEQFSAFVGHDLALRGTMEAVVRCCKQRLEAGEQRLFAIFDESTGARLDIDFSGSEDEALARLADHPLLAPATTAPRPRGRGRPKLGVVSREVSLLPSHWEWLSQQRGGASATLRRLVMEARRGDQGAERIRHLEGAVHRFIWDMAGDLPGFEEASRAFFARDYARFEDLIAPWPTDIRAHLGRYLDQLQALNDTAPPVVR